MECSINTTNDFDMWWDTLDDSAKGDVTAYVRILREKGVTLRHPYSSEIKRSRHGHMRELRVQSNGRPFRVLYAFDPNRNAILLIGGDKTGNNRWYQEFVPIADRLYDQHLESLGG